MQKKAFTLIELLVVIAVIALLLSVLLPSLKAAKELASGIVCCSNQKQLQLGWTMYTIDNGGKIVGGKCEFFFRKPTSGIPPWVKPPLTNAGSLAYAGGTLEERKNGLAAGAIYKYLDNPDLYHCPGDKRVKRGTSLGSGPEYRIYRSYSLPIGLAPNVSQLYKNQLMERYFYEPITKSDQIKNPSGTYTFVEEAYDGKTRFYNDEHWNFYPFNSAGDKYAYRLRDPLAAFHVESATFAFADGHAERHKWRQKRTADYFKDRSTDYLPGQLNEDIEWLADRYPYLQR